MSDENIFGDDELGFGQDLVGWVMGKVRDWESHYDANYRRRHEEYMRLYRNEWSPEDAERKSERSRLIAPALAQAVESNVAEIEESTFGRGKIFDIKDNFGDDNPADMVFLRNKLHEDMQFTKTRTSVAECLLNAAVYGTGIGEIVVEEVRYLAPSTQPANEMGIAETGVVESWRPVVKLNPIQPQNFRIDPAARCPEDALGCAIDEFVSRHYVEELQESGVYKQEYVGDASADSDIEFEQANTSIPKERIRLTKYYGKVPRELLLAEGVSEDDLEEPGYYVEAVVVIGNEGTCLKAMPSPYMCQDRPIVAFQWDLVPNSFWGRGVCEKGYMSQKALDTELRARQDALALTTHPMMAVDATRIPRGHKLEVRPGRMIMTNGNPGESLMPFKFGELSAVSFQQGAALQAMVSQATGAAVQEGVVQNDVTAAGQSMSQGALMKRQKRTLVNFQENFLVPLVEKTAKRYMQFAPEQYPVKDYSFVAYSSLGAMAREYEVSQLTQMLQMVGPQSPAHGPILEAIIDHMNVANREQLIQAIQQGMQPDPAAAQAQQQAQQAEAQVKQAQVGVLQANAMESQARAQKYNMEAQLYPQELTLKYSDTNNDGEIDHDFEKRMRLADLMLREQELQGRQDRDADMSKAKAEAELMRQLTEMNSGQPNNPSPAPQAPAGPTGPVPPAGAGGPAGA